MRFVIATLPDVKFSLGRDLTLVKACALYGDESVLFSPTYAGTKPLLDFSRRPLLHQLVYLALLKSDPGFVVGEKLTHSERTARIRRAKEDGERFRSMASTVLRLLSETGSTEDAQRQLDEIVAEVRPHSQKVESVWSEETDLVRRARELARAQSMGFVTIENIHDVPSLFFNPDNLRTNVVAELDRPEAYGALDERFLKEFSGLSDAPAQKMGVALVATQVLAGLPSFADATFEEIRDARAELAPHLASFRKAIVDISGGIRSTPWDRDFPHEVELELQSRMYPAVAEIEECVRENSYLKEIVLRAAKNPLVLPASSAFGLLLSGAAQLPTLIGQVASGLAGAGVLALEAHKSWKDESRQATGNKFFFYYRAAQLLEK